MANKLWDQRRKALTEVLKRLRVEAGVTQIDMANRLDKPQSYVSKYESGERKLDFVEVMEICEALGIKPKALIDLYEAA